jgi:hypothetical protein
MSSSYTTSANISINSKIDELLTSAKKSNNKKSKKKISGQEQFNNFLPSGGVTPTPSQTSNPFSTCGPLQFENEFFQFYAELYRSAVLFSDPKYQQELLFPNLTGNKSSSAPTTKLNNLNVPSCSGAAASLVSPTSSLSKKHQRNVKKAQRRLSGHAAGASTGREFSSAGSNSGSGGSGSGSMKHLKSDFEQFVKTIAASTPLLPQQSKLKSLQKNSKGKIPGLKRKVSFSKVSPRMRSRSNSNQQSPSIRGGDNNNIPWISIQEHCCWSSDMDETDTTETEDNASSTLGEGDDVVFTGKRTVTILFKRAHLMNGFICF